jgi:hypothetical protein
MEVISIMNPQNYLLARSNLLAPMKVLILSVLNSNWQSTRQLDCTIKNNPVIRRLSALLSVYNKSGFSTTSSFVGSVASNMSKSGRIKHTVINNEHFFKL